MTNARDFLASSDNEPEAGVAGAGAQPPERRGLLATPRGLLWASILGGTALRLLAGACLGLGTDESYQVAQGRHMQLSFFDHPPLSYWIGWTSSHLLHSESPLVVRLPFIALFIGTCRLLYAFARRLFDDWSAAWSVVLLNLTLLFGLGAGGWYLPDGPMLFALLASAHALVPALREGPGALSPRTESRRWRIAGAWLGVALMAKYLAVLYVLGLLALLLLTPRLRLWLRHPAPYGGLALALLLVTPVLVWNAQHGWVSFAFQGSRGLPQGGLHPEHVLSMLAGEAAYVLPWLFVPLVGAAVAALLRGPNRTGAWICAALGLPGLVAMTVVPLWGSAGLPHWPAASLVFLFPLLGARVKEWLAGPRARRVRRWLAFSGWAYAIVLGVYVSHAATGWASRLVEFTLTVPDPTRDMLDWQPVEKALQEHGYAPASGPTLATLSWVDGAKLAQALGARWHVTVLTRDPRNFAFQLDPQELVGKDMVFVGTPWRLRNLEADFAPYFGSFEPLGEASLGRCAGPEVTLRLVLAKGMRRRFPWPYGLGAPSAHSG